MSVVDTERCDCECHDADEGTILHMVECCSTCPACGMDRVMDLMNHAAANGACSKRLIQKAVKIRNEQKEANELRRKIHDRYEELPEDVEKKLAPFRNDPYRAGAAQTLDKPIAEVTSDERLRFKEAFFSAFFVKGPDLLRSQMNVAAKCIAEDHWKREVPEKDK